MIYKLKDDNKEINEVEEKILECKKELHLSLFKTKKNCKKREK